MAKKLKKSEKKLLIALGIIAVVGGIMLYRIYGPSDTKPVVISESVVEEEVVAEVTPSRSYSSGGSSSSAGGSRGGGSRTSSVTNSEIPAIIQMSEFEKHYKPDDCWVLVDGIVYDISSIIKEYPSQFGGATDYCGTLGFEVGFLGENNVQTFIDENSEKVGTIG